MVRVFGEVSIVKANTFNKSHNSSVLNQPNTWLVLYLLSTVDDLCKFKNKKILYDCQLKMFDLENSTLNMVQCVETVQQMNKLNK